MKKRKSPRSSAWGI